MIDSFRCPNTLRCKADNCDHMGLHNKKCDCLMDDSTCPSCERTIKRNCCVCGNIIFIHIRKDGTYYPHNYFDSSIPGTEWECDDCWNKQDASKE